MNIKELVKEMTFHEKASFLTGSGSMETFPVERLGIPSKKFADGPHGIRLEQDDNCTLFPNLCSVGSSWDTEITEKLGEALGHDCIEHDIDMILAPGINIKKHILCGRNFEYISEDPVVSGEMGAAYINGVQKTGVGTSLKHYALNSQEKHRTVISSEADERTMREIYLKGFEIAVKKSNPTSVMCAYNKVNSIWCGENKYLLTDVLKDAWKYDGFVVSDWGAVHDIVKSVKSGLDLQMPSNPNIEEELKKGLDEGKITMAEIDKAVENLLKFVLKEKPKKLPYDRDKQHKIAHAAAAAGTVLLKNDNNVLPLTNKKYKKIAVVGEYAKNPLIFGQGSAEVYPKDEYIDSPLECLKENLENVEIKYYEGYKKSEYSDKMIWCRMDEYYKFIEDCDAVVLFLGSMVSEDTETFDRMSARLNNNFDYFINGALNMKKKTAVVIQSGGALILEDWHKKVDSIVEMYLGGEAAGGAIADILTGKVNPSGKLAETFPNQMRKDLEYPGDGIKVSYDEKLQVGYRYYDKHPEEITFPFGHGLSYTEFSYSDLSLKTDSENISVSFNLKNTGDTDGAEVVQIYIGDVVSTCTRPIKELKAFKKVFLKADETKKIDISIPIEDLGYYNIMLRDFAVEDGAYKIYVASSSQDIRLCGQIEINGKTPYTTAGSGGDMIG